jgi:hypothetical protein
MLQSFTSTFDSNTHNFNITLTFYGYKYTLLSYVNFGALMAVPQMYNNTVTQVPASITQGNEIKTDATATSPIVVSRGYQKMKEVYSIYKSKGLIDDIGIWNRALTQQDITALYNSTNCNVSATISQTNVICNGGSTGSESVTATGGTAPYTYSWAPRGGSLATANNIVAGTYTCTITDANQCTITKTVTITQPIAVTATTTQTNVSCNGGSTGSASVTATGGTAPYTYSWAPSGGTLATASNLAAGNYTCTITDANQCTITKTVTITSNAQTANKIITIKGMVNDVPVEDTFPAKEPSAG